MHMDAQEFRSMGHKVVDQLADYLGQIESKRVFPDVDPAQVNRLFDQPLPQNPSPADAVLDELEQKLFPYCTNVGHPGYMGLITPSPNPVGIIGDFICSALNQNIGAYSIGPAAVAMERTVVRWLTDLCGYDEKAGGNLTSGGMMANFIGLKLGRDAISRDQAQHDGIRDRCAVYVSEERHVSVDKAVDCIGLGRNALRPLPTNERFEVRLDAMEEEIARDKASGVRPLCVIGIFGTTIRGPSMTFANCGALRIAKACGCTSMQLTAAACFSPTSGPCAIADLGSPTRSRLISTSGFTRLSTRGPCW